ncbi:TolC family protein [Archangium primigenium]|uniref:TolC family protein n=1 Tax=[Archangium] primigenium TaxID=2792470 RepID=UPI00195BA227|nr:TolC family protein [Archangium primigenium]MBM7117370.1 TolC family protein [Archangium primigenium]
MFVLLAALALAAAPVEVTPMTFAQAVALAGRTPGAEGAARAVEVQRAERAHLSALVLNPQVVLEPGYRQLEAQRGADLRLGVSQGFNLSGQVPARTRALDAEATVLEAEARAVLLARRLAIAEAWLLLWAAEQAERQSALEVTLATSFHAAVEGARALGAATALEGAEASAYLAEARLAALDAEGRVAERRVGLSQVLGESPTRRLQAGGALPEVGLPPDSTWDGLVEQAARLPEVVALALGAEAERARAAEQRASRGHWLQVGVAGLREFDGATGGALTLTWTPPLFERGGRERASQLASATRQEGEAREAGRSAGAALALAFHEVVHAREGLDTLQGQLLPATEEAARLREFLFQSGESTVPEVVWARRALASARVRQGQAQAAASLARVRARFFLDALSGVSPP